jgi:hypothetical protein
VEILIDDVLIGIEHSLLPLDIGQRLVGKENGWQCTAFGITTSCIVFLRNTVKNCCHFCDGMQILGSHWFRGS